MHQNLQIRITGSKFLDTRYEFLLRQGMAGHTDAGNTDVDQKCTARGRAAATTRRCVERNGVVVIEVRGQHEEEQQYENDIDQWCQAGG